jgi:hypothetical protein
MSGMAAQYSPPPPTEIMVAVAPEKRDRLLRVLEGHKLIVVETREEARRRLDEHGFGIILLGVHFDESQMFTLLSDIRHHSKYQHTPVLVVLSQLRYPVSDVLVEGLDHAVKAMSANGLLRLEHFPDDEEGNGRIRRVVDYLILIDGDLHHVAQETGDPLVKGLVERRQSQRDKT